MGRIVVDQNIGIVQAQIFSNAETQNAEFWVDAGCRGNADGAGKWDP
jgi:hypothetical protein